MARSSEAGTVLALRHSHERLRQGHHNLLKLQNALLLRPQLPVASKQQNPMCLAAFTDLALHCGTTSVMQTTNPTKQKHIIV